MECKYILGAEQGKKVLIKIETYWNVNHSANVTFSRRYTIKIETYWNVNMLPQLVFLPLLLIKIETYWKDKSKQFNIKSSYYRFKFIKQFTLSRNQHNSSEKQQK